MTKDRANEILFLWKVGAELFPPHVINQALYLTGDLSGPDLEASAGLVRAFGEAAGVEGLRVAPSAGDGERRPVSVLEAARVAFAGDAA